MQAIRRCAFSSSSLTRTVASSIRAIPHGLFSLVFPADCRVCNAPLREITRVPVCSDCLHAPQPLEAEFFCSLCRAPFANQFPLNEEGLCAACSSGLQGFDRAASFGFYEGTLRKLIHLYKYDGMKPLAGRLSRYMERAISVDDRYDAIVPVPLHWYRKWRRGFNQTELLAREIGNRRRLPVVNALKRRKSTPSQSGLTKAARRKNMTGAFALGGGADLAGKRVLLIDDVFTTGATAAACARVLKSAGAASVSLLTLARADRRWRD